MKRKVPFPKWIDRPPMFGPFELDEAAFIVGSIGFWLLLGFALGMNVAVSIVVGLAFGLILATIVKGLKVKFAEGFVFHKIYKIGLRHPVRDNAKGRIAHPELFRNGVKLIPDGYIATLVE